MAIDLRSDTVTRPTALMRAAMAQAPVGDDVFGDDPTVLALQERVAAEVGQEAALFMPSGTQSNLVALLTHCGRGDEYLVGQMAHMYRWEGGGAAVLGGIQPQPILQGPDGRIPCDDIRAALKPIDDHYARSRLLCLENTWMGQVLCPDYTAEALRLARSVGLQTHLDGARLFNAAVASGRSAAELAVGFDTVSVCFSKGLGAPMGSALCGPRDFVEQARRWRKVCGGGLRQAGIVAAAALVALDQQVSRLVSDHERAARLAQGLEGLPGVQVQATATNMLFLDLSPELVGRFPQGPAAALSQAGVLCTGHHRLRLVTHLDIDDAAIDRALAVIRSVLGGDSPTIEAA